MTTVKLRITGEVTPDTLAEALASTIESLGIDSSTQLIMNFVGYFNVYSRANGDRYVFKDPQGHEIEQVTYPEMQKTIQVLVPTSRTRKKAVTPAKKEQRSPVRRGRRAASPIPADQLE